MQRRTLLMLLPSIYLTPGQRFVWREWTHHGQAARLNSIRDSLLQSNQIVLEAIAAPVLPCIAAWMPSHGDVHTAPEREFAMDARVQLKQGDVVELLLTGDGSHALCVHSSLEARSMSSAEPGSVQAIYRVL